MCTLNIKAEAMPKMHQSVDRWYLPDEKAPDDGRMYPDGTVVGTPNADGKTPSSRESAPATRHMESADFVEQREQVSRTLVPQQNDTAGANPK